MFKVYFLSMLIDIIIAYSKCFNSMIISFFAVPLSVKINRINGQLFE